MKTRTAIAFRDTQLLEYLYRKILVVLEFSHATADGLLGTRL